MPSSPNSYSGTQLGDYLIFGALNDAGTLYKAKKGTASMTMRTVPIPTSDGEVSTYLSLVLSDHLSDDSSPLHDVILMPSEVLRDDKNVLLFFPAGRSLLDLALAGVDASQTTPTCFEMATLVAKLHHAGVAHQSLSLESFRFVNGELRLDGLGRCCDVATPTMGCVGLLHYLAPETLEHAVCVPAMADAWALGVAMFGVLYQSFPFDDVDGDEVLKKIHAAHFTLPRPDRLADVVSSLLRKDPAKRKTPAMVLEDAVFDEAATAAEKAKAAAASADKTPVDLTWATGSTIREKVRVVSAIKSDESVDAVLSPSKGVAAASTGKKGFQSNSETQLLSSLSGGTYHLGLRSGVTYRSSPTRRKNNDAQNNNNDNSCTTPTSAGVYDEVLKSRKARTGVLY
eukprot:PhM_4_TR2781/c0_g1_i1/m.78388/K16312/STK40, SHIK; serine/threonine-protein kinase 40